MRVRLAYTSALFLLPVAAPLLAEDPVSFHKQVRPLLARSCQGCHNPGGAQSGLSLATYQDLLKGGSKGPAFVAGTPEKSLVIAYLTGEAKPPMPFGGKPLPGEDIELFRRWIREGAKDDSPAESPVTSAEPVGPTVYHAPPVITALAISPDGRTMAISGYREILLNRADGSGLTARLIGQSELSLIHI